MNGYVTGQTHRTYGSSRSQSPHPETSTKFTRVVSKNGWFEICSVCDCHAPAPDPYICSFERFQHRASAFQPGSWLALRDLGRVECLHSAKLKPHKRQAPPPSLGPMHACISSMQRSLVPLLREASADITHWKFSSILEHQASAMWRLKGAATA